MAGNSVTIDAKLNESGVVSGAKKVKVSLDEIKKADGSLNWSGMKEGESAAEKTGDGFTVFKGILANLATQGIQMAIGAVKDFCANVVNIGQTFETSMSKVSALSGATGDELGLLEAKARELGASTTFSASEAADALGYMALAGWDTQQMLDGVGSVLTLAQAGELDLAAASDLVTDYLSAFNMEASETSRMVDVLAYAQANANTTVEGLGMAFKNCAANANAAGLDIETTSAAISMMANQGLKGSEAGTALNAVLRDMTAKMENGSIAIGKQSVAVMDAEGNYRDFTEILADVAAATDGMGDAEKAAALQSTFTADSIKGLNLMLNAGADEMDYFRECLYNAGGTAEETAAIMTDNLGGDLAAMGSAFEELSLKIYEGLQVPLRSVVQFMTGSVVPALTFLIEHIEYVAMALASIGFAVVLSNLDKMANAFVQLGSRAAGSMAGLVSGPVALVIAAIAALAAAFMWGYDNVGPFHDAIDQLVATMAGAFGPILEQLGSSMASFLPSAMEALASLIQSVVVPALTWLADFIITYVVPAIEQAALFIETTVLPALSSLAQWVMENVVPALQSAYDWFAANIIPILGQLASFILSTVVPALANIAQFIFGTVVPALGTVFSTIGSFISGAISAFQGFLSTVGSIFNAIREAITNPIETAKNIIKGIIDTIKGFFSNFHIQLPHINLPHFSINPPGWQIGDLLKGSIPSLGIEWYATGGVFNGPSIIGVGEAGTEFVVPRDGKHMLPFAEAVADNLDDIDQEERSSETSSSALEALLAELVAESRQLRRELPQMLEAYSTRSIVVNKREFARAVEDSKGWL